MIESHESVALDSTPTHVFFEDVHFSRPGESMAQFLSRLKSHELRSYRWMFPQALMQELDQGSFRGRTSTFQSVTSHGTIQIVMHKHENWKTKLFDTEVGAPPPSGGM